jgi:flagellar biosynthesis/type III secretory pathway protein FliH
MPTRKQGRSDFDSPWKEALEEVRQLFRLIDWLMELPIQLQQGFREEIFQWEEERRMPYVTSIERLAKAEGLEEGRQEGRQEALRESIVTFLQVNFGSGGKRFRSRVNKITDVDQLRVLFLAILKAESLDEVRELLSR